MQGDEIKTGEGTGAFDDSTKAFEELVLFVARYLVTRPDDVKITRSMKGDMIVYEVHVADEDKGRVIGKNGRTAKALRAIVGAAATKAEKKATVEIID